MTETKKKRKYPKKPTIAEQLLKGDVATTNALENKTTAEALAGFGYTQEIIEVGRKLVADVETLNTKQRALKGEQLSATDKLANALMKAKKTYMATLIVTRIAFRDDSSAHTALALGGTRKTSTAGILDQAAKLYRNIIATEAYLTAMKVYGYSIPKLEAEFKLFEEVAKLDNAQERAKAAAQKGTHKRNEKLRQMQRWLGDFKGIAKAALGRDNQALESFGIVVKS